ncbi:MAG: amidohydrolase family protein [Spirochaetaceae bacterium]|nr:MAG: amidohydrolase family protein [Spirochaetaceae bacterium]
MTPTDRTLIDSHIHFCDHTRLVELERYCGEIGADRICVLSLPVKERINFNPEALLAKVHFGERCYALGSFDFSAIFYDAHEPLDLADQVRRLWRLGFDGLKIFAGKPSFQRQLGLKLDDPPFLEALREAERLNLPVLMHVADPPVFWPEANGSVEARPLPGYEELQRQALAVLESCPALPVIFPHLLMMAHDLDRLARILQAHRNAHLDLAPGLYFYGDLDRSRGDAREFFHTFRERILFGSDGFWFTRTFSAIPYADYADNLRRSEFLLGFLGTAEQMDNPFPPTRPARPRVRGLALETEVLDRICRENFRRLYPPSPRRINRDACLEYAGELRDGLAAVGTSAVDRDALRTVYRELEAALRGARG